MKDKDETRRCLRKLTTDFLIAFWDSSSG